MAENRPSARQRGYDGHWEKARASFLAKPENQFCARCKERGLLNVGQLRMDGSPQTNPHRMHLVVNHKVPHKGDQTLFWDRKNWEVACPDHHDIRIQQEEHGTFKTGTDVTGRPLDPAHPWNAATN